MLFTVVMCLKPLASLVSAGCGGKSGKMYIEFFGVVVAKNCRGAGTNPLYTTMCTDRCHHSIKLIPLFGSIVLPSTSPRDIKVGCPFLVSSCNRSHFSKVFPLAEVH